MNSEATWASDPGNTLTCLPVYAVGARVGSPASSASGVVNIHDRSTPKTTTAAITALEHVGDRTWPTLERSWYDGWLLRASEGVTGRSNSATALYPSTIDVAEKMDVVEQWFEARDLPTIVRTLPITEPALADELVDRGYRHEDGAHVMTRDIGDAAAATSADVTSRPEAVWLQALSTFRDDRGEPEVMRRMLLQLESAVYVSVSEGAEPVAIGMGASEGDTIALFNMNVAPSERRRGLGTTVLNTLLGWGRSHGASRAMLQVHTANKAAIAFYESAGFDHRYTYVYWVAPQPAW